MEYQTAYFSLHIACISFYVILVHLSISTKYLNEMEIIKVYLVHNSHPCLIYIDNINLWFTYVVG